jgi:hypothetical protein
MEIEHGTSGEVPRPGSWATKTLLLRYVKLKGWTSKTEMRDSCDTIVKMVYHSFSLILGSVLGALGRRMLGQSYGSGYDS